MEVLTNGGVATFFSCNQKMDHSIERLRNKNRQIEGEVNQRTEIVRKKSKKKKIINRS